MRISFFETEKWEEQYISEKIKNKDVSFCKDELNIRNVKNYKDSEVVVCFIHSKIDKRILDLLPKVKYIATMSTGFDHIDLEECKKRKISVSNVPFYGENTVAEHAFALMLNLSRKINQAIEKTKNNDFSVEGLMGFDLKGKTLGVIGPGHIGQHVIKMAKAFEMNVIAYSDFIDKKVAKQYGFSYVSLDKLLSNSDIITIHSPLTPKTKHLINMNNVKKIKKGAYLINTARGEIIDTKALIYALDKGIIAGAGLDVLEGECYIREEKELLKRKIEECDMEHLIENHLLLKEKNVIVTPHSAFYSKEAIQRIMDTTLENISSFKKGKILNKVC